MNWVGDLVQKYVEPEDTVLDIGCGIMQAILDTCPTYPSTRLRCRYLVGADIYEPYLEFLKKRGIEVLHLDLRYALPFHPKSFDVILLLDVLEHLSIEKADKLVLEATRIAKRKVIVLTPVDFQPNLNGVSDTFPYQGFGENIYQLHLSLVTRDWLEERGFKVVVPHIPKDAIDRKSKGEICLFGVKTE